ncbi:hypothetical protein PoB_000751200 [Plakobranchus ocellatus]|uniref:Uncharacterized protein n=1 Tax=Plakobranchus ocellatus TaxID=259542 RepID=A0AAV3YFM1_9GAST|nr:hypothetical protein PoB_000751200 [Plakobranchus ocellatus]
MDGESAVVNVPDGDSTIVGVPHGDSTIVGVSDGGSVVVTLNLGSVRTRGRPKGQDRINRFAKKRKWATNSVVGESAVVDSCVLCGVCGDIELAREFCVNGMIKRTLRVEWEYDMRKRRNEEQKAAMGSRRSEGEQFRRSGVRSSCYAS